MKNLTFSKVSMSVSALALLAVFGLAGCGGGGGGGDGASAADTAAPTVSSTSPTNSATGVAVNTAVTATFSETMDTSTVSTATFTLNNGVTGTVTYSGTTATFTPSGNLAYSTTYTATISTSVKDAAGNAMAAAYVWTFTTGTATPAPGATFKMPDTNQTTSYTPTFGEDHDYTINPPSYTDNGDGTITDNVTGLVWQKQDDATTRTWADAGTYCDASTLGGYSDWRLPSQIELISIIDNGVYSPSINTTFFPGTISSGYWSSTTYASNTAYAWDVNFGSGNSFDVYIKTHSNYVRCVRGGQTTPSLTDNGNGTVTDSGTLLTWQQGENSAMTWEAALSYCEGLSLAGATDWRLPNHKELLSLIDYTRYNPSINTTFFQGTSSSNYWSSTTDAGSTAGAWGVLFYGGGSSSDGKTYSLYVRCVRGGSSTADTTPPTVSSTSPANTAAGVAVNTAITATFSETMTASTVTTATFTLNNGVTGAVTYSGTTATFTASSNLASNTTYTATITTGVKDAVGNAMANIYSWSFTTGSTAADTTAPSVPTGLLATALSTTQINLTWNASTDNVAVTAYKVSRSGTELSTSATLSYLDSGLTASTQYCYKVSALDAAGNESSQTGQVCATTLADWTLTSFPADLNGNWYADVDGSWQWGITGSTTIRTWNRFFSVLTTYANQSGEYKVITTEGGRWYPFFFKNITATNMQATFPDSPNSLTGFSTETEALQASPDYPLCCSGQHK